MIEVEYMSKDMQLKMEIICEITKYLLNTDNIMYSSGEDGYDYALNMYSFFQGNILEYKEYKMSAHIVLIENELTIATILSDLIGNK